MSFFTWWTQRIGALSIFSLLALSYYVVSRERAAFATDSSSAPVTDINASSGASSDESTRGPGAGVWTFVFAYYSLFIHVLITFFPLRACWAIWELTTTLKKASSATALKQWEYQAPAPRLREDSIPTQASFETRPSEGRPSSTWSDETVAPEVEPSVYDQLLEKPRVIHAVMIPNYKEDVDVLRETLDVLASHPRARTCYDIYLGMEEREVGSAAKALGLIDQYAKKFRSIDFTSHPGDIPGESAGKGSNLAWTARKLSANYSMTERLNVVVTGIDADSHLSSSYFSSIADMHLAEPEVAQTSLYSAPLIFDRNAHRVAGLVRVADIIWCAGGISGLYRGSSIAPPTSVYSLPLQLVDRVGGWDSSGEAIGEDLHMYIKCFFALNGNLTSRIVPSPISSSNVSGIGGRGIRAGISDVQARSKQALRHMWGALDAGYSIRQGVDVWRERKRTAIAFQPLHKAQNDDGTELYVSHITSTGNDELVEPNESIFAEVTHAPMQRPHLEYITYLYLRLFEAHFLPTHMFILVFATAAYLWVMDGQGDPNNLMWTFWWSKVFRTGSFAGVVIFLFLYERYHRICVTMRHNEMTRAGLAEGMDFSYRTMRRNMFDYFLMPVCAPLYGTVPSFRAIMSHLWTTDLVYAVSRKPVRRLAKTDAADIA